MGRLLHLSDLHFGTERAGLVAPLIALAQRLQPDVVVISGDLTQRALPAQWAAAAELIAALPAPVLCVPGNHDVPLYNPLARLLWPFRGYRKAVAEVLEPVVDADDLLVVGLNTTDPYAWQRGVLRKASLRRVADTFARARPGQLRVVALHHPLTTPPATGKTPMRGADAGPEALARAGADVILSGHLHLWAAAPFALHKGARSMLCVQAGTTLSSRLRGEDNDLNVIDFDQGLVTVTRWRTVGDTLDYTSDNVTRYQQDNADVGWGREGEI
ncbi:metallophosphoesterase family protein [Pseudotabrizicola alkalilacus]|uniref:Metallophosphoesterase n=1 Tax=Pseudotabrizicola alkalilacus TaxID=2305252 RepID=A0A411Z756_9RHOB|nr:metallophosphoesterase [Pseudotabrizicola alkalilacus]RGP38857.1 metallophosphoesterase [Pseudotabrizicola alkalilacus]